MKTTNQKQNEKHFVCVCDLSPNANTDTVVKEKN